MIFLPVCNYLFLEQRNELLQIAKNNPNGATRQALEIIDQLGHPDKYVRLLKILDKAGIHTASWVV